MTYLDNLHLATKESHFIIKETLYKQVDGVFIGSTFCLTQIQQVNPTIKCLLRCANF